ncbi:hypothetical protein I3760_04G148600 [Carya illinoinensis]|nr:hypothetical protein I3760_04G148600 [Carya illinoinensis]
MAKVHIDSKLPTKYRAKLLELDIRATFSQFSIFPRYCLQSLSYSSILPLFHHHLSFHTHILSLPVSLSLSLSHTERQTSILSTNFSQLLVFSYRKIYTTKISLVICFPKDIGANQKMNLYHVFDFFVGITLCKIHM